MKKNTNKKFKTIYLVPVIFLLIVIIVGLSVFQSLFQDGPIYGERCTGVTEIASEDVEAAESSVKAAHSTIEKLEIEVRCKTIAVDLTLKFYEITGIYRLMTSLLILERFVLP